MDVVYSIAVAFIAVALITQLVFIGPSARFGAPALLDFGAAGVVQDALIRWLLSWLGRAAGAEPRVDGIGAILLAALITRAAILAASHLAPSQEDGAHATS